MVQAKSATTEKQMPYATSGEFCRIFSEDMSGLYLLGLLLTGDDKTAEQCFVSSLEDAINGSPVFKEWARSWARRTIVRNAIRLVSPKPAAREQRGPLDWSATPEEQGVDQLFEQPLLALLELPAFDRFVFIITVLEKMREHECCVLLGCSRRDVVFARRRVLEALAYRNGIRDQAREFLQPAQVA